MPQARQRCSKGNAPWALTAESRAMIMEDLIHHTRSPRGASFWSAVAEGNGAQRQAPATPLSMGICYSIINRPAKAVSTLRFATALQKLALLATRPDQGGEC